MLSYVFMCVYICTPSAIYMHTLSKGLTTKYYCNTEDADIHKCLSADREYNRWALCNTTCGSVKWYNSWIH